MPHVSILFICILIGATGCSQHSNKVDYRLVGAPCEGCEAVLEYGNKDLQPIDTLPDFYEQGEALKVSGTIFHPDGSPAKGVILYLYHTNQQGIYATKAGETGWAKRHGYIRGWVKTDKEGHYTFYTLIPGIYPDRSNPAHIHPTILEPNGKYYWIESYHFAGDPLLTEKEMNPEAPRGGSTGVLTLKKEDNTWVGRRDIMLGKNVPGY
ncbi:MAG: intradiol ring-cleavage dioxygenase [Terrimonas sp.]|nr:intradiol ring-cleavage dioxygenase [Terrimonas sp.]